MSIADLRSQRFAAVIVVAGALALQVRDAAAAPATPATFQFPAADGLEVTADAYAPHPATAPFIVLFHRAGSSRGEYREIAPKLNELGFNCMAVDQRAGDAVAGVKNETAARALAAGKGRTYLDALGDMEAAIALAREKYAKGKLLVWGSSYSASLVLKLASDRPTDFDGILAFAPGEYFGALGKPKNWIASSASLIRRPVFITSARGEVNQWKAIFDSITAAGKVSFVPKGAGKHGSEALWSSEPESEAYWQAVRAFLAPFRQKA